MLIGFVSAVAIGAALAGLAMPTYYPWIARYEETNSAQARMNAPNLARGEAIRRASGSTAARRPTARPAAGRGSGGGLSFADSDRSGGQKPGEWRIAVEPATLRLVAISGNPPLRHDVPSTDLGHARRVSGARPLGTFDVCRGQHDLNQRLAGPDRGRARIQATKTPRPERPTGILGGDGSRTGRPGGDDGAAGRHDGPARAGDSPAVLLFAAHRPFPDAHH